MKSRRVVAVLCVAMALYLVFIGQRAIYLFGQDSWWLKLLALAIAVFPIIGIWVVGVEVRFGFATQQLGERLTEAALRTPNGESLSVDTLPRLPSGRIEKTAAQSYFDLCRESTEQEPQNWERWYVLAQAYDMCGDRRRAREAMRRALRLADDKTAAA